MRFEPDYLRWCLAFFRNGSAGRFAANSRAGLEIALRSRALMEKYHDAPMDLADATLVALAETLDQLRVFTLDRDFEIYRWKGKRTFELLP